jgi:hypothetical protein
VSSAVGRCVELSHEFAVGCAGRGEVFVAFLELETQVDGLLFKVGDLLAEGVDVCGGAEPGFVPGLIAECLGQALFEQLNAGGEPDGAFVSGEQVGLQGCSGDARAVAVAAGGRGGFECVELGEQVAVTVEEGAVHALLTELDPEFQQFNG